MHTYRLLLTVALVLSSSILTAEEWADLRGPTGQGHTECTNLPTEWSPTKNVAWKQSIPGKGWSTPIRWKDRVFLTTAVAAAKMPKADQSLRCLCLDLSTGKILWNVEIFQQEGAKSPGSHGKNSHASPSAVTDGERVYVHFGHMGTAALDFDGKILWKEVHKYNPVHGNGGSPILVDDLLVYSCDGSDQQFVVALDRRSGKTVWKTPRNTPGTKRFSFSTPVLITVGSQRQIISPGSDVVLALEPTTGKEIWRVLYKNGYSVVPRPVFGNGLLYVITGYDSPELLAIKPDGTGDVTESHIAWRTKKNVGLTPSLLLHGSELFMVSDAGIASCLNAMTGETHWQQRLNAPFSASPLLSEGKLFLLSEDGQGIVLTATKEFKELGRNEMKERTFASYSPLPGGFLLRTETTLYRVAK
jgi:outer membrane protein assembly factor BamB